MKQPILVPLDGSVLAERALPFAEALAEASGSPLLLLCASYVANVPGLDVADEQARMVTDSELYLRRVATRLRRQEFAVETCAPYGLARQVIVREARVRRAWLIVMATHGRGGLGRALYGSVADGVVRQAPVPVLLLRAWHSGDNKARLRGSGPILVPLDRSAYAEEVLPIARTLVSVLETRLILAQAIPPPDPVLTTDGMAVAPFGEDREVAEREAREYLARLAATFAEQGICVETIVRHGEPAATIAAIAEEQGAALTVLATHGRTGLDRLLMGSVAEQIVRHGATPVMLVRSGQGLFVSEKPEAAASVPAGKEGQV
jgi:nucleotide-binding universal stress UspA family protein